MRVRFDLTPLEYLSTPANYYYELVMAKSKWEEGINGVKAVAEKKST